MATHNRPSIGSISHGTLRTVDLIPRLVEVLSDLIEHGISDSPEDVEYIGCLYERLGEIERNMEERGDYFDSEYAAEDLDWLSLELQASFAPPYCYFGAVEGDGSDFGFWVDWYAVEDARYDGELPSGDGTPDERTESGYFLVVSDHGNATLYEWADEADRHGSFWREVWGVV